MSASAHVTDAVAVDELVIATSVAGNSSGPKL
jgi:hypothetical protein